ncbi:MAG: c-type cytochrome [Gammaproteobacteria bacterium]|nr:c-type cytochrome [Gammaproteobacteria bacterium]
MNLKFVLLPIILFVGMFAWNNAVVATEEDNTPAPVSKADLDYGEEIYETCAACHGEYGEGTLDGEYPRLAGFARKIVEKQLRAFKARERHNIPMIPYTEERELPEGDLVAVSAFLETIKLATKLKPMDLDEEKFNAYERLQKSKRVINIAKLDGDIEAGKQFYDKECSICHARDGSGKVSKLVPPMVGQHSQYLRHQMQKYRDGKRLHDDEPGDREIFQKMTDKEMHDMLSYLSILDD